MAEYTIGPTPRNKLIGLLADATQGVGNFMEHKDGLLPINLLSQLLGVKPIARTLDNLSYGRSLGTGTGMTWRPTADTADAAMTLAPLAKAAPGMLNAGAAAIGSRLEAPVAAMVNKTLNKGGLPAQLLQDMAQGTQSKMIRTGGGRIPETSKEIDYLFNQLQSKADALNYQTKSGASNVSGSRYLEFRGKEGVNGDAAPTFQVRISNHGDRYPNASSSDARFSVDPDSGNTFEMAKDWLKENGFNLDKRAPKQAPTKSFFAGSKASEINALRLSRGGNPLTADEINKLGLIDDLGILERNGQPMNRLNKALKK
jgi:hypothetical protein